MSKEASMSVIKDFVSFSMQGKASREHELTANAEHQERSLDLYNVGKKLLDRYGGARSKQIAVGAGRKIIGMRFDTVSVRSTPMIPIKTEKGGMLLTVSEDFTTGPNYYKTMDRVKIEVFFNAKWDNLFDVSQAKSETKNWLGKKATPEQMTGAIDLLFDIARSLKEKYGEKIDRADSKK